MNLPLNFPVLRSPMNWIIVFLMLVFSMFIVESVMALAGIKSPCGCQDH